MKTLRSLYDLAEQNGIEIIRRDIPNSKGITVFFDGNYYIGIHARLSTSAEEKTVLAHEIGHCLLGALYTANAGNVTKTEAERRADQWAIEYLAPEKEYREIPIEYHGAELLSLICDTFDVTSDFADKIAHYYEGRGENAEEDK